MSKKNIIRAWKDSEYRASLSDAERAQLPANPAGLVELNAPELEAVEGGRNQAFLAKTYVCVWCVSQKLHADWNVAAPRG